MSRYVLAVGEAMLSVLEKVPTSLPSQVAGYWSNRDFWIAELEHLILISNSYDQRHAMMKDAVEKYEQVHGADRRTDGFGKPFEPIRKTTTLTERKRLIGRVRSAIIGVADHALNLRIISVVDHDKFMQRFHTVPPAS